VLSLLNKAKAAEALLDVVSAVRDVQQVVLDPIEFDPD